MANVLVPDTVRLEVPVVFVIAGLVPLITKLPTVKALLCRSSVALLSVSKELVLPKVPLPETAKVPALTVVAPP